MRALHAGFVGRATLSVLGAATAALAAEPLASLRMEEIVLTPSRIEQRRSEVPESVAVLAEEDVRESAALAVDDFLRQIPGFSLFRRSSSLVAHPTAQGVTLRGIAPSGASRTLVLLDGVPLNDPFGGWVYWSRVPLESLERIEVVRGGGSGVWGNAALGGVIQLFNRQPKGRALEAAALGGNRGTWRVDALAADRRGPVSIWLGGHRFDTGGYPVLRGDQRGPIDEDAASDHAGFRGRATWTVGDEGEVFLGGNWFSEDRENGTRLTRNSTEIGAVSAGARWKGLGDSEWRLDGFGQLQSFASTFSSQEADRSREQPALDQFDVPATAAGTSLQWARRFGGAHGVSAGFDFRWVDGETNEDFRNLGAGFTRRRRAGGEQRFFGLFVEDQWKLSEHTIGTASLRGDLWENDGLFRHERSLEDGSIVRDDRFGDRDRGAVSPRVGVVHWLTEEMSIRGLFYGGFRAPTLNELVRPFRVRNDVTEANASLDPERLLGGEIGADYAVAMALARVTGFWNEIDDPIANVTVGEGPGTVEPCGFVPEGGVCRQRRNLGASRVRGIEAEVDWMPRAGWFAAVQYLFNDARVTDAPGAPGLEGKRLAQVPRHQVAVRVSWAAKSIGRLAAQVRWVGEQFEDDQNELRLGDFAVVDLLASRAISPELEVFFGVENLFDRTIPVGKTTDGLVTIGAPLLAHGGLRWRWGTS